MRKIFHKIHVWLTIPFGILMVLLFVTGALLVFEKDVVALSADCQPFFKTVKQLHRWLLDSPPSKSGLSVGRAIMGISTIATSLTLISGIFIWVPKSVKALKNRLKIVTDKGIRRFFYDWHVAIGIYTVIFLLLMTLTGPVWTFGWYREAFVGLMPDMEEPVMLAFRIHTGSWGGMVTKVIYFISALLGATLTITGYYLWIKKKFSKR